MLDYKKYFFLIYKNALFYAWIGVLFYFIFSFFELSVSMRFNKVYLFDFISIWLVASILLSRVMLTNLFLSNIVYLFCLYIGYLNLILLKSNDSYILKDAGVFCLLLTWAMLFILNFSFVCYFIWVAFRKEPKFEKEPD